MGSFASKNNENVDESIYNPILSHYFLILCAENVVNECKKCLTDTYEDETMTLEEAQNMLKNLKETKQMLENMLMKFQLKDVSLKSDDMETDLTGLADVTKQMLENMKRNIKLVPSNSEMIEIDLIELSLTTEEILENMKCKSKVMNLESEIIEINLVKLSLIKAATHMRVVTLLRKKNNCCLIV